MTSHNAARDLVDRVRSIWDEDIPGEAWLEQFLEAVGTDPATLPPEILEEAAPLVPLVHRSRPGWDRGCPVTKLASAPFPNLVVSGGHSTGFDAICDGLADQINASRAEVTGAGHEIQFSGPPINEALLNLWRRTE